MAPRLTAKQIADRARAYGLDPSAVLAVARSEGLSGGIGDAGHAYGPFQLNNAGGVITGSRPGVNSQQTQDWAWSQPGIDFALQGMSRVARGKRGGDAVRALVSQYERPADIQGEIARSLGYLGQQNVGAGAPPAPAPVATPGSASVQQSDPRQGLIQALGRVNGGDYSGFYRQLGQTLKGQQARPSPVAGQLGGDRQATTIPVGSTGIAKTALTQLGTPYQWGGKAKLGSRTDCSGLLQASARANGINIGRTTYEQFKQGSPVSLNKLAPGDAIFMHAGPRGPEHVVIYVGGGKIVEDPHTGAVVSLSKLAGRHGIVGARRYG